MVIDMTYTNVRVTGGHDKRDGSEARVFYLSEVNPECMDVPAHLVDKDYIENDECMEYCFDVISRKGNKFHVYFEAEELEFYTVKC